MKKIALVLATICMVGCDSPYYGWEREPMWERGGGLLNPWGGEFLDISISRCIRNTRIINERKRQNEINYNNWAKNNSRM